MVIDLFDIRDDITWLISQRDGHLGRQDEPGDG